MKRFILISLLLSTLLSSCSFTLEEIFLLPTKTPTLTPSPYMSPTLTPSQTATLPTPTYTLTPTLIGVKSPTPTILPTDTPTIDIFVTPDTKTPTMEIKGFLSINAPSGNLSLSQACGPVSAKFTVQASDPIRTEYVTLFVRLRSKATDKVSDWTNIEMEKLGAGTFTHELAAAEIQGTEFFKDPWLEYQIVATTISRREIGRTDIYKEKLTLLTCEPTQTPTATLSPTATVTQTPTATPLRP